MTTQYSLQWESYKKNICNGLSYLQQNGEFVDMTLAADGHFVKVHQVVLAIASPFIKHLITSAQCQHPIIFLNKISYKTLCFILEYVYTGEVSVPLESFDDLKEAAQELHINGLADLQISTELPIEISTEPASKLPYDESYTKDDDEFYEENATLDDMHDEFDSKPLDQITMQPHDHEENERPIQPNYSSISPIKKGLGEIRCMQYTVSNQGRLQMILNRFVYYLKHTNRSRVQQWRCVDYISKIKCRAYLLTKGDKVIQRTAAHTHPFHDKKILKKARAGSIFSVLKDAQEECTQKLAKFEESKGAKNNEDTD